MSAPDENLDHGPDSCEAEPIRSPAAIQPHGVLLCIDEPTGIILAAGANHALLPPLASNPVGQTLQTVWPALAAVASPDGGAWLDDDYHVVTHCCAGTRFIEIEPAQATDRPNNRHTALLRSVISDMNMAETLESLTAIAAEAIRDISGMERVLIYRFTADEHGEVVAESRVADWDESFIGFHFPSADIPAQARALYLVSPSRFTPIRDYAPVPLVPERDPRDGSSFDLGLCQLRSLSPTHRRYQANLGVDGAMSMSIINEGRLWGLVVGHHRHPHRVPIPSRDIIRSITVALSMRLSTVETVEEREARARHVKLHAKLLEQIAGADDFIAPLMAGDVKLTDIFFASSGAALVYRDDKDEHLEIRTVGLAPDANSVEALAQACRPLLEGGVYATDHAASVLPAFSRFEQHAAGFLAITIGESGRHMIVWFRPEIVSTTVWGGAAPHHVEAEKRAGNYLPRKSFARWVEERRGHSRPWPTWKLEIARSLRTALNDVILRQMRTIKMMNSRLAESDRAKSRFLAHMSHELRTPMNAVLGFSEMLESGLYGPLEDRQLEGVGLIREASRHLLTMINDLLDLAKVESGRMEMSPSPTRLDEMTARVLALLTGMAREAGVTLHCDLDGSLPALWADQRMVKQMMLNILSNAIKFTPRNGSIRINAGLAPEGGLWVAVADTGIGIPAHQIGQVLEPFRQAHENVLQSHGGTGLGLPIVKALIELHGGSLHLESREDQGTTVTLRFPRDRLCA